MPNRILKESINESRKLSEVSFFASDLYKRLITYADDYGRFNADYQIILARLYPREIGIVSVDDIEDALTELSGAGKIAFYTSEPRKEIYGCFPKWEDHQNIRTVKSKYPDPGDTQVNDYYLRRFVPLSLKKEIVERDGFKCCICKKYLCTLPIDSERFVKMGAGLFDIDHIVPVNQGGRATLENLRLTCRHCNRARKKRLSTEEIIEISKGKYDGCADLKQSETDCNKLQQSVARIQSNPNPNPNPNPKADAFAAFAAGDMDLLKALNDFSSMRKVIKKPMTDRAKSMLCTKLEKLSGGDRATMIAILDESTMHSWSDVYELKKHVEKAGKGSGTFVPGEEERAAVEKLRRLRAEGTA